MRKIEQDMLQAINDRRPWSQNNTTVIQHPSYAEIYLHGNLIATVTYTHHNGHFNIVNVHTDTLRQYPTRTTKSRLRALGVRVAKHDQDISYEDSHGVHIV